MLKDTLKRILSHFGLVLVKEDTFRGVYQADSIDDIVWSSLLQPIFEIDISITRDFFGFDFSLDGYHPYTSSLLSYSEINTQHDIWKGSALEEYYSKFQPSTSMQVFFDESNTANNNVTVEQKGLYEYSLPWDSVTKKKENNQRLAYSGPISEKRGISEIHRLVNVYNSIKTSGYRPQKSSELANSNHIQGYFLKRDQDYRFIALHGKHRLASLAVLGYKKVPVTFEIFKPRVVDIRDINSWPMVRKGYISSDKAEAVFNFFFDNTGTDHARRYAINYLNRITSKT